MNFNVYTGYYLGIIFSIGSISEDRLIFRHKYKYFLEQIQKICGNNIYRQTDKNKIQYVLKTRYFNIDKLKSIGWTARNSDIRFIPKLLDYKDFLRAYIELHSGLGYSIRYKDRQKRIKYKALRLRIYGNEGIINSINNILNIKARVSIKSPQKTSNKKTFYIAYTSLDDIQAIFDYIKGYPCFKDFWIDVLSKLDTPRM